MNSARWGIVVEVVFDSIDIVARCPRFLNSVPGV